MSATSDTAAGLLRAIAMHPGEDTPRLLYADYLDENATCDADRARAELIRHQIASVTMVVSSRHRKRTEELIRTHETAWRRPPCVRCEGSGYQGLYADSTDPKCSTCHGTGSTGPLSEKYDHLRGHRSADGTFWKHAVTWVRGFPVVRCRLDEVGKEDEPIGACNFGHGVVYPPTGWTPTPWGVECVRVGASFEVTDCRPFHREAATSGRFKGGMGWDWSSEHLPRAAFDEIATSHPDNTVRSGSLAWVEFVVESEALAALNAAVLRLVVRAAYPEEQQ